MSTIPKTPPKGEVVFYKNKLEVRLVEETVWLSQKQLAGLFDVERRVITKHIRIKLGNKLVERCDI